MRVLVNALPARSGGGVTYVVEEIRALEAIAPDCKLELVVAPWSYELFVGAVRSSVRCVRVRTVADRFLFEQTLLRGFSRAWDVLYCPLNFGPVLWGGNKAILTLHNPNYFGRGLTTVGTEKARPWAKVKACHAAVRQARTVVAISDAFYNEVVHTLPAAAPKIRVVKSGRPSWREVAARPVVGLPGRFFLVVGSAAPHKRLEHVVEGWASALTTSGEPVGLVIAAGIDSQEKRRHRNIAGQYGSLLIHLGAVSDRSQLRWLYENARAMVSMSVLEAFPLTIGEAGALGCPLILSDIPEHREVSLGNAVFVMPEAPAELARALPEAFSWQPRSRPWVWPVSWNEHATMMFSLFAEITG